MNAKQQHSRSLQDLLVIISDPAINELFVSYAQMKYNIAVQDLKSAREPIDFGRAQGQAKAWEDMINIKQRVQDAVMNAG